jgi:hypothetical protein
MTVADFVKRNYITADSMWSNRNPSMDESDNHMNHYKTTLRIKLGARADQKRQMTLHYSKGKALTGDPTAEEVLDCLKMDMQCIENGEEDFIDEFGYKPAKGHQVYRAIEKNTQKLYKFLGADLFNQLKEIEDEE